MKPTEAIIPVASVDFSRQSRVFSLSNAHEIGGEFIIEAAWNGHSLERLRTDSDSGLTAEVTCTLGDGGLWVDERVVLNRADGPVRLSAVSAGLRLKRASLEGFTATPVPFRVGLDGLPRTLVIESADDGSHHAEGWVVGNGERGMLVMRVPSGSAYTCFVPLVVNGDTVQVGSIGPDGADHRERNPFLDVEWEQGVVEFPPTRFVFFEGDWRTGYGIFREMVRASMDRSTEPRRGPCPITYNTYHDFGPSYDKARMFEIMPQLASMGIGMLHLDPGWETVWGSNVWNDAAMGDPREFVEEARRHGLEVGCWTSVHTTDSEVHAGAYALDSDGRQYYAEDFTFLNPNAERLWGVCPASDWQETAVANLSRLGNAGIRFLNSDFHDWPWSGASCHSREHRHDAPLTRAAWAEALNEFYIRLHLACPEMVIELHDHVESGEYRTPAWYLYDRPGSYDEKWAYEFMWKTYQDLMERKLFALYYLRLAEPIPLYLHINASSDNENALAFWYVASCVTHVGVGAILKCSDAQREGYRRAFEQYNARSEAFTSGEFFGIDELTHVHVYPDRRRAVLLAFNLEDHETHREIRIRPEDWDMLSMPSSTLLVAVAPRSVALVDI